MNSSKMPSPYDYQDIVPFLKETFQYIKSQRPRYSLRSWSLKLGFRSAASLSRILSRNRRTTLAQVRTISKGLGLSDHESLYLETIVQFDEPAISALAPQLRALFKKNTKAETLKLSLENFAMISEWYYSVIQAALCLNRDFKSAEDFLEVMNENSVSVSQVKKALKDLQSLGCIVFEDGKYRRAVAKINYIEPETASMAVRHFHGQMLAMAQKSIFTVDREHRDVRGATIAIKKSDYLQVQNIITEAMEQILALAQNDHADQVYHLSTAFFPLSK